MQGEHLVDDAVVGDGVPALEAARGVHHVDDEGSTVDVAKERLAQPLALMGALDEPRDVGRDERAAVPGAHDAEVGDERREGIVRDLRPRGAHARD